MSRPRLRHGNIRAEFINGRLLFQLAGVNCACWKYAAEQQVARLPVLSR
jgi:hypothetical protein